MQAIWEGEIAQAYKLIDTGVDLNMRDDKGRTALIYAIRDSNPKLALYILGKGADFNLKDDKGWEALHWSVDQSEKLVRDYLLKNGADVNALSIEGDTPILVAAKGYDDSCIKVLHTHGGNLNHHNQAGYSAMMIAYELQDYYTVQVLLKLGAIPFSKMGDSYQFDIPIGGVYFEPFYDYRDQFDNNHLLQYISKQDWSVVDFLIDSNFPFEDQNAKGENALILLTQHNQINLVHKLLLDKNVYLNIRDFTGLSALDYAKKLQFHEIYDLLKKSGAHE